MALAVKGLQEMNRAFKRGPEVLNKEWTKGQTRIAEPTQRLAKSKALTEITRMRRSPQWAEMRIGKTQKVVYVAPKERSRRYKSHPQSRRKTMGDMLMDRAMQPALEANAMQIFREFDGFLAAVGRDWERH